MSASGGEPQPLTTLDKAKKEASHRWPQALPGGEAVLFTSNTQAVGSFDQASLEVVVLKTGARTVVHSGGSYGRYVPSGHLVYVNKGTMFAVPFNLKTFEVTGTPAPVVQNVTSSPAEGGAQIAFSATGLMGYIRGGPLVPQYPIVWVDRDGRSSPLLDEPGAYANPRLSPDGRRLSLTVLREGNWDIWVYDLDRQVATRLTFDEATDTEQVWSPDGREIVFSSDRNRQPSTLYRKPSDGSGEEKEVVKTDVHMWASSWSPDRELIAVSTSRANFDIGLVRLATSKTEWLVTTPFAETDAAFSPDGRWVAYVSSESGQSEVYVRPVASGGGRWQISDAGGAYPRWARDGRELVYRTNEGIMAASIEGAEGSLRTGKPRQLFAGAFRGGIGGDRDCREHLRGLRHERRRQAIRHVPARRRHRRGTCGHRHRRLLLVRRSVARVRGAVNRPRPHSAVPERGGQRRVVLVRSSAGTEVPAPHQTVGMHCASCIRAFLHFCILHCCIVHSALCIRDSQIVPAFISCIR